MAIVCFVYAVWLWYWFVYRQYSNGDKIFDRFFLYDVRVLHSIFVSVMLPSVVVVVVLVIRPLSFACMLLIFVCSTITMMNQICIFAQAKASLQITRKGKKNHQQQRKYTNISSCCRRKNQSAVNIIIIIVDTTHTHTHSLFLISIQLCDIRFG